MRSSTERRSAIRRILVLLFLLLSSVPLGCRGDDAGARGPDSGPGPAPIPAPPPDPEPAPAPGWVAQDSGTSLDLNVVTAVNGARAWSAEGGIFTSEVVVEGGFRRTEDGGAAWSSLGPAPENQIQVVEHAPDVRQIRFFDAQKGWAVTRYSVLSTADGGSTWVTRSNSLVTMYLTMSAVDPETAWVLSERQDGLLKTTDGGQNWAQFPITNAGGVGRVLKFVDAQVGWAAMRVGNAERVYRTMNGGATWIPSLTLNGAEDSLRIRDIAAVGHDRAWIVGTGPGGSEILMATTNAGGTWSSQHSDGSGDLRAAHFIDANTGWAVGRKIHHTTDGGATWKIQPTSHEGFLDVIFVNATTGWVVGSGGVILKTTTGGDLPAP